MFGRFPSTLEATFAVYTCAHMFYVLFRVVVPLVVLCVFCSVKIASGQRVSKLDEKQTADMIKITCQRPDVRQGAIHQQFSNINGR